MMIGSPMAVSSLRFWYYTVDANAVGASTRYTYYITGNT